MLRLPHYLTCAAGAAALLAQTALAQANGAHAHEHHHVASAYRHRLVPAAPQENFSSQFYGPFGGYADAAAVSHYAGPNARRYFGSAVVRPPVAQQHTELDGLVEQQASANGVPASLVHRVIKRESGYNPRAVSAGNYGLMQIRLGTARAMGYGGSAAGLLDAETNMTYAVKYLGGAYRAAGGNEARAVALYARGY
jgi:soluble lytic murein transglycosylase-like protein